MVAVMALTSPAIADLQSGPFVSGGGALGLALHDAGTGLILGGEISGGYLWVLNKDNDDGPMLSRLLFEYGWVGGYADVIRDFASDRTRVSFGPELGRAIFGFDGGLLLELGDEQRTGITLRPAVTFGIITVYVRFAHFFDELSEPSFFELGILVKKNFLATSK